MELTCAFLQGNHRIVNGVSVIGRNTTDEVWMFSPSTQLDRDGNWVECNNSRFVWLPSANGLEGEKRLHCTICMPLDDGEALKDLYAAVEAFMPDNAIACLATMASCIMRAAYEQIITRCGHVGVPFLFGEPGSCKTEAILCGLALFGAYDTHLLNSQTTASYLFGALKRTTIPIAVDDINEKTQDIWEELITDAYNNTAGGTRSYIVESFSTIPILSANWRFPSGKGRAFTRCISIPFIEHKDEPNAPQLYSNLKECRIKASASAGVFIRLSTGFTTNDAQMLLRGDLFTNTAALYQNAHVRFKTMMTIFMYFFLKVYIDCQWLFYPCIYCTLFFLQLADLCEVAEDTCWDFVSSQMVPLAMEGSPNSNSQLSNPGEVVDSFISVLAQNVADIPRNEVCM